VSWNFLEIINFFPSNYNGFVCSEYDTTKQIFVNSYPWLFPGGIGDLYDMERGQWSVKEWGKHLMRYYDGRFLNDQFFCLFVHNTIQRHHNNSQGNFFFQGRMTWKRGWPTTFQEDGCAENSRRKMEQTQFSRSEIIPVDNSYFN